MRKLVFFLLLSSITWGQNCVSASPNVGNSAAVAIPFSTLGQHVTVFSSIYAGTDATASITDTTLEQAQTYTPLKKYSANGTGISNLWDVSYSVELQGQEIVATWLTQIQPTAPTITVCTLPSGSMTHQQGYATALWAQSMTVPSWVWVPAVLEVCVAAGDTPMSDWQTGSGWWIPDGATTDHSGCAFTVTQAPYFSGGQMSWIGPGFRVYGLLVAWATGPVRHR